MSTFLGRVAEDRDIKEFIKMRVTTIRFNLKFFNANGEEEVVRTLADLRSKFNLCDLWDYFKSGDLVKWLKSIDELTLAASVESLNESDKRSAMQKLCEMLGLSVTDDEVFEMCEVLDHHERAKDWHEKMEKLRAQMKSGTITSDNESADIFSLENQYYIDDFNSIMGELKKFEGEDFSDVEKLKKFEQKFVSFLNRWGRTFISDFANKLFKLRFSYNTANTSVVLSGSYSVIPQYKLSGDMVLLLTLMAVNKRWGKYLCYSIGNGTTGGGFRLAKIVCDSRVGFLSLDNPVREFSPSLLGAVTFVDPSRNYVEVFVSGLIF